MPVHFKFNGGSLQSGRLKGGAEMYISDEIGNGEIYKGNFIAGKLNDPNGIHIVYTDTQCVLYRGVFIDNVPDGQIEEIIIELSDEKTENEIITGNCHCGTKGRKYIYLSMSRALIDAKKKIVIYSNGIRGAVLSEQNIQVSFNMSQKQLNNRNIFCDFSIEVE